MNGDVMSDGATTKEANKTVEFLLKQFSKVTETNLHVPDSYAVYDLNGNRSIKYRAACSSYGINAILEYYFNKIEFYYDEQRGLTGLRYGDVRIAAEPLGYYDIISYAEAEKRLLEGDCIGGDLYFSSNKTDTSNPDKIRSIELMYGISPTEEYYQPYYCFYMELGDTKEYCRFYVPAAKGAPLDGLPPEPEMKVLDFSGYECLEDLLYAKDSKYYTVENGEIVETTYTNNNDGYHDKYGTIISETTENGSVSYFYYGGKTILNLTELMKEITYDELEARYMDGKIVIICSKYIDEYTEDAYISGYVYSIEEKTLKQVVEPISIFLSGIQLWGRYATRENMNRYLLIIDFLDGSSVNTGISCTDIKEIMAAGDKYYAIIYNTGEIGIIEAESGQLVKKTNYQLTFTPSSIRYKDGMVYIKPESAYHLLFVVS